MSASNRPPTPMLYLLALLITLCKQQEVASFPFPNGNKILQKPFLSSDIAATTRHRNLQEDEDVCSFILEVVADPASAPYCSCDAVDDTYVLDCILTDCPDCDLIQGVDTCALSEEGTSFCVVRAAFSLFSCTYFILLEKASCSSLTKTLHRLSQSCTLVAFSLYSEPLILPYV
jgi:hypothetical protein